MNFSDIIRENSQLKETLIDENKVEFRLLSNITINQLSPIIEYSLRSEGINVYVEIGEYDNIIQESNTITSSKIPIIFWELCNLKDVFVAELDFEGEDYFNRYVEKVRNELDLIFNKLSNTGLVLFNKFSHLAFSCDTLRKENFENFVDVLNSYLTQHAPANFLIIDIDKIIAKTSTENAIDWRGFYSSKSLYTTSFLKAYTNFIKPAILSVYGKTKKALIFDCDNTLWKGIVGEDGIEGIELSEKNKSGIYFKEIHLIAKYLNKNGIVIGLCSKNNEVDVEEVFKERNDFSLLKEEVVIKRVNWKDKASNLKEMATELNIGIDSFVFIDDSDFELNLVKEKLPEVNLIAVPKSLYTYPHLLRSNIGLFFNLNRSVEDTLRTQMYRQNELRKQDIKSSDNIEDYLRTLEIKVEFSNKNEDSFERIVQLTQKTNQFNLTTKRYINGEMRKIFDLNNFDIIAINVKDKFGDFGLTGVCILEYREKVAFIDTLLMSCRILGRNIEQVFLVEIINHIANKGCLQVESVYFKTVKNSQVEMFYENIGFEVLKSEQNQKDYIYDINTFNKLPSINYIQSKWKVE